MRKNLPVILYTIFLLGLLCGEGYLLFYNEPTSFEIFMEHIILLYLVFRIYIFIRLSNKAKAINLTLTEYLARREIQIIENNIKKECECNNCNTKE